MSTAFCIRYGLGFTYHEFSEIMYRVYAVSCSFNKICTRKEMGNYSAHVLHVFMSKKTDFTRFFFNDNRDNRDNFCDNVIHSTFSMVVHLFQCEALLSLLSLLSF